VKIVNLESEKLLRIIAGCICMVLGAKIRINFEGLVLFSFQSLCIVVNGYWLRNKESIWSLLLYFTLGLMGFEVFAGKTVGLAIFSSPTLGFFIGFFAANFLGIGIKNWVINFNWMHAVLFTTLLHFTILLIGYVYFYWYTDNIELTIQALTQNISGMIYKIAIGSIFIAFANKKEI
jgi:biotin transporter BioY